MRLDLVRLVCVLVLAALLSIRAEGGAPAGRKIFHDASLGYTIRYPQTLYFTRDAARLRRVMRAGLDALHARESARRAGTQFIISLYPFSTAAGGRFNPNLALTTASVAGMDVDTQGYAAQVVEQLPDVLPQARLVEPPRVLRIGGRAFSRLTVRLILHGLALRLREYVHVSRRQKRVYAFTITDRAAEFAAHAPVFESIVQSVRFDDQPRMVLPQSMR